MVKAVKGNCSDNQLYGSVIKWW